jgi:putative hydrolase of the HAD superfamily
MPGCPGNKGRRFLACLTAFAAARMHKPVLIIDAFGVLYRPADDVAECLIPFVRQHGGSIDAEYIKMEYRRASLGLMRSAEFWERIGLDPNLEDEYLALIPLTGGVHEFLDHVRPAMDSLWCLSYDISEWSRKLRDRHDIAAYFNGFVISGDVGIRKPDRGIYESLLSRLDRPALHCTFVDDRVKNLDAAKTLGFHTALFGHTEENPAHLSVGSFPELEQWLLSTERPV